MTRLATVKLSAMAVLGLIMLSREALAAGPLGDDLSPFGVSSSAQASGRFRTWMPKMSAAGVRWARVFPDWNQLEASPGKWDWSQMDAMLDTAAGTGLNLSGLFLYNAAWVNKNTHTFPTNDYPAWTAYVSNVVRHAGDRVHYWEVWNEPESFAAGGTAGEYARVVTNAYYAAKAISADAQIGLSVASVDVHYLEQTIRAGAADHFDFICVHPYEVLDTVASGQEALFMSIVPTLRKMLAATDPARSDVPVWFTELGEETNKRVSAARQAQDLIKAYTMGIAQGVRCIEWFEAQEGGYKMGLLNAKGEPTPAYRALQSLTAALGPRPLYLGWVLLNARDYAFVFQGGSNTVTIAWARPNSTDRISFKQPVTIVEPLGGTKTNCSAYELSNSPIIVLDVPKNIASEAAANKTQPFPWDGNYTGADAVSLTFGQTNLERGLHPLNPDSSSITSVFGVEARDCSRSSAVAFTVDPNFLSYTHVPLQISAKVRKISVQDHPGFNLKYESANGTKGIGWNFVPGADRWYTLTWTLADDEFVGKWGYHFSFDSDSTNHSGYYLQSVAVTKLVPPYQR